MPAPRSLKLLIDALRRAMWRHGPFYPERLRHSRDLEGRHRIEIVLDPSEVHDDLPESRPVVRPETLGAVARPLPPPKG